MSKKKEKKDAAPAQAAVVKEEPPEPEEAPLEGLPRMVSMAAPGELKVALSRVDVRFVTYDDDATPVRFRAKWRCLRRGKVDPQAFKPTDSPPEAADVAGATMLCSPTTWSCASECLALDQAAFLALIRSDLVVDIEMLLGDDETKSAVKLGRATLSLDVAFAANTGAMVPITVDLIQDPALPDQFGGLVAGSSAAFFVARDSDTLDFVRGSRLVYIDAAVLHNTPARWGTATAEAVKTVGLRLDNANSAPQLPYSADLGTATLKQAPPPETNEAAKDAVPPEEGDDQAEPPKPTYMVEWAAQKRQIAVLVPKATCDQLFLAAQQQQQQQQQGEEGTVVAGSEAAGGPLLRFALDEGLFVDVDAGELFRSDGEAIAVEGAVQHAAPPVATETTETEEAPPKAPPPDEGPAAKGKKKKKKKEPAAAAVTVEEEKPPEETTLGEEVAAAGMRLAVTCRITEALMDPEPAAQKTFFGALIRPRPAHFVAAEKEVGFERDYERELRLELDDVVTELAVEMAKVIRRRAGPDGSFDAAVDRDQWLFALNTSGVYHCFKERLKPAIQRLVRTKHGGDAATKFPTAGASSSSSSASAASFGDVGAYDRFVNSVYGRLMKQAQMVANARFRDAEAKSEPQGRLRDALVVAAAAASSSSSSSSGEAKKKKKKKLENSPRAALNSSKGGGAGTADEVGESAHVKAARADQSVLGMRCEDAEAEFGWSRCAERHEDRVKHANTATHHAVGDDRLAVGGLLAAAWRDYAACALRCAARRQCLAAEVAEPLLVAALTLDEAEEDPATLEAYAAVLVDAGRYDDARAVLAQVRPEEASLAARVLVALCYECNGQRADARSVVDACCAVTTSAETNDNGQKKQLPPMMILNHKNNNKYRERVEVLVACAEACVRWGLPRAAAAAYKMAAFADARAQRHARQRRDLAHFKTPTALKLRLLRCDAAVRFLEGDTAAAEMAALKALALAPKSAETWILIALIYAEAPLQRSFEACDAGARALAFFADQQQQQQQQPEEEEHEDSEPPPLWLYCFVADRASGLGDVDLAAQVFLDACRKHPKSAAAWRGAGRALLDLGSVDEAEQAFSEANLQDKDDAATWCFLALANLRAYTIGDKLRLQDAAAALEQAELLEPTDADLLVKVALAFLNVDLDSIAVRVLRRAIDVAPRGENDDDHGDDAALLRKARTFLARALTKQNALLEAAAEYAAILERPLDDDDRANLDAELAPILTRLGKVESSPKKKTKPPPSPAPSPGPTTTDYDHQGDDAPQAPSP